MGEKSAEAPSRPDSSASCGVTFSWVHLLCDNVSYFTRIIIITCYYYDTLIKRYVGLNGIDYRCIDMFIYINELQET